MNFNLILRFGRMFPDFSLAELAETSSQFLPPWTASGIVEHGQLLTLSSLALHSGDSAFSVCSLAEILEPSAAPKYYLSPRACRGILRRAAKRGRALPPQLEQALVAMAISQGDEETTTKT